VAIPRETNKELVIVVEDAGVDVAISPPIIDGAIVVGQVPPTDPRTLLYDSYTNDILNVRTVSGVSFQIGDAAQSTIEILEQVVAGVGVPSVDGQFNNRIYMDSENKGIYIWSDPDDSFWADPQVTVSGDLPPNGKVNEIHINTATNSIWMWL
jgi:hypothetical protein